MAASAMNSLSDEVAGRGVSSVFIYTREAHPGEHYPHHDSFQRKLDHARALRDVAGVTRTILVDDMDGTCHTAYGGWLPNMAWIVSRRGTVAYKADWTDARDIRAALDTLLSVEELGPVRSPFYSERLAFRAVDHAAFMKGLERNGPKAVSDFTRKR